METTTKAKKINKAVRNPALTEPTSLTRCGMWNMHKANLARWAVGVCFLEHLSEDEVKALTKEQLVNECLGALLRLEVAEDHRAAATDTQSRSLHELVYGVPA